MAVISHDECCGNCEHHESQGYGLYLCSNLRSPEYARETLFTDYCEKYKCRYRDEIEMTTNIRRK